MDDRWHRTFTTPDLGEGYNKYFSIADKGMLTRHLRLKGQDFKTLQGSVKCQSLLMSVVYLPLNEGIKNRKGKMIKPSDTMKSG